MGGSGEVGKGGVGLGGGLKDVQSAGAEVEGLEGEAKDGVSDAQLSPPVRAHLHPRLGSSPERRSELLEGGVGEFDGEGLGAVCLAHLLRRLQPSRRADVGRGAAHRSLPSLETRPHLPETGRGERERPEEGVEAAE